MAWTDERVAQLKALWEQGLSASQIAQELGEGLSRNAVIGKAHRLGLSARPSPLKNGAPAPARAPRRARPASSKPARPAEGAGAESLPDPAASSGRSSPAARAAPARPAAEAPQPPVSAAASRPAPGDSTATATAGAAAKPPAAEAPAAVTPRPVPEAAVAASRPRPKGQRVSLLDLNDRICKWPIGHPDEADFHFCGRPVSPGFPYCADHCLVAYQAQQPRRDRPGGPPRPFGPNLPRPR